MGACTFVPASGAIADEAHSVYEGFRVVRGHVTFSASYATGGDTLPLASIGLQEIRKVMVDGGTLTPGFGDTSGLSVTLGGTPQAPTLLGFDALNTQLTAATNNTTRTIPVWFLGSG